MPPRQLEGAPGPRPRTVRAPDGVVHEVPEGWELLPPGDALATRRVKAAGAFWSVAEKVGRREMSRGVWAPAATIARVTAAVEAERASPEHARRLEAGRARRGREQAEYVLAFERHVTAFLAFAPCHAEMAARFARRVAEHATPVGSGTVARTERIPVAERAEAAVIAWLRHQTTAYDHMTIAREKGARREVRRALAKRSRELLERYRRGEPALAGCPLARALAEAPQAGSGDTSAPHGTHSGPTPTRASGLRKRLPTAGHGSDEPNASSPEPGSPMTHARGALAENVAAPDILPRQPRPALAARSKAPARPVAAVAPARPVAPVAPVAPTAPVADSAADDAEMERRRARQAAMRARLAKR